MTKSRQAYAFNGERNGVPVTDDPDDNDTTMASFEKKPSLTLDNGVMFKQTGEMKSKQDARDFKEKKTKGVGIIELFKFADKIDVLLILAGTFGAMLSGLAMPFNIVVYGQVADDFIMATRDDHTATVDGSFSTRGHFAHGDNSGIIHPSTPAVLGKPTNSTESAYSGLYEKTTVLVIYFCIIAIVSFLAGVVEAGCWDYVAERQVRKIRQKLFDSILRQDITWFDLQNSGELSARFSEDVYNIKEGLGDKVGVFIKLCTTWLAACIIAIATRWKLALAAFAFSPLVIITGAVLAKIVRSISQTESKAYSMAGAVAEEAISSIRTVTAFGGQQKECNRYCDNLLIVKKTSLKKGVALGISLSVFWVLIFVIMGFCFWYATKLFQEGDFDPGDIIPVFFGVMMGSISLGHALPYIETFALARGAAARVYEIIGLAPVINENFEEGEKPSDITGSIKLDCISFQYPSRQDITVLNEATLEIPSGKTIALVGASGSGKSTVIQLLQRFYDPECGKIYLDGQDIRSLNLKWYRDQIGVVSQEPVLFPTTIGENIRYGREGVTQSEIEEAAKEANAFSFIEDLPQKYDTVVGGRGQQLSGGQKQRIAIARALVKKPKILLLDEATSALDNESEVLVQKALDDAQKGRTTLVIAHRLSTIRNADQIIVMENGQVMEVGSHKELMDKQDYYYRLVTQQATDETESSVYVEQNISEERKRKSSNLCSEKNFVTLDLDDGKEVEQVGETSKEEEKDEKAASLKRIIRLNSPEWMYIVSGCIACVIAGGVHPAFAFIFSEYLTVFTEHDKERQMDQALLLCYIVLGVAACIAVVHLIKMVSFVVSGSRLTLRLRKMGFEGIMRQDISFFDDPKNQVGHLTTRLSSDATLVQGATGSQVGVVLESIATILAALIIAFIYGWKLTFVVLSFFPLMVVSGLVHGKIFRGMAQKDKKTIKEAGNIYSQVIDCITTVTSLNAQRQFQVQYDALVDELYRKGKKRSIINGVVYGFSNCIIFFAYAATFSYGAYLIEEREMEFQNVFRVFGAIVFGGMAVGRQSSFTPDYMKAKLAAQRLFDLMDKVPAIDCYSKSGTIPNTCSGEVDVLNIQFRYPARPDVVVLEDVSLKLKPGKTIALVGPSGCGKSTVVQLLERFYDTDGGVIGLDNVDIKSLNISWLRSQIGIVSQEPVLFDCSIAENIAYGDNTRILSMPDIIAAARAANIHSFIESLPQGYDTNVGAKGTQLSGGQKQRVAIARALVRNPKILLLDEATSALDTESERVVQEALDKAAEGRTCIIIAHRLSTIVNADQIAVINNGLVEEIGTHSELIAKQGKYYKLHKSVDHNNASQ